jgi:hypothetical protein
MAESTVGVGMMPVRAVSLDAAGLTMVLVDAPVGAVDESVAVVDEASVAVVDEASVVVVVEVVDEALVDVVDSTPVAVEVLVAVVGTLSELHPSNRNDSTIIGVRSVGMSTTEMERSGLSWLTLLSSKPLQCCARRSCTAIKL